MDSEVAPRNAELAALLDAIYRAYHYDFRRYSEASLLRRLRNALVHFKVPTLPRLQDKLLREPAVFTELLRFLTVQVSDMFRDPIYFRALRGADSLRALIPPGRTYLPCC